MKEKGFPQRWRRTSSNARCLLVGQPAPDWDWRSPVTSPSRSVDGLTSSCGNQRRSRSSCLKRATATPCGSPFADARLTRDRRRVGGFLRVAICLGKHEPAVGPEPEECGEADPEDVVDIELQRRCETHRVVGEVEPADPDEQADSVDEEEQQGLVVHGTAGAMTEGPQAIAQPRDRGGDDTRNDAGGSEPASERSVEEQVEPANVDDEGHGADDPELRGFAPKEVDGRSEVVRQSANGRTHPTTLVRERASRRTAVRLAR